MTDGRVDPDRIGVVGAGTMGRGIAATFLINGIPVALHDRDPKQLERAREGIESILELFLAEGMIDEDVAVSARERARFTMDLEPAVEDADLVIEAVSERMDVKTSVFSDLEAYTSPETVLASNTSGLSITEIAAATDRPERVLGTHWFNPPHIVPLVEVVKGDRTDDALAEHTAAFLEDVGKTAVVVETDIPGYIGNRIQTAMCYEAFSLLERGIASAEDIDKAVKAGFGFRLPAMGVFEKADHSGLDIHHAVESYLLADLDRGTEPSAVLERLVEEGRLGVKTGSGIYDWSDADPAAIETERDEALLDLLSVYEDSVANADSDSDSDPTS